MHAATCSSTRPGPLAEDVEVTGPIEVVLWVSSDAPDTDFTAKLIDSYPPSIHYPYGFNLNLTDSIIRLRYRHGDGKADPLPAGEVARIKIILLPASNLFAAGHRIRLDISSSNFPRFDVNPNTGEPLQQHRRQSTADNTVYHGPHTPVAHPPADHPAMMLVATPDVQVHGDRRDA